MIYKKSLLKDVERIERKKALGIFYNVPEADSKMLINKLLDERRAVHIHGVFADDVQSLKNRLGNYFKIKHFDYDMLPAAIDGKILLVTNADYIRPTYAKVFEKMHNYGVPMILIMKKETTLDKIRKFREFNKLLTIEIDYSVI